jgi:hypothetical protein
VAEYAVAGGEPVAERARRGQQVPATDVDVVGQRHRHRGAGAGPVEVAAARAEQPVDPRLHAAAGDRDGVARPDRAADHRARETAEVIRPDHVLDGQPVVVGAVRSRPVGRLPGGQRAEQRRPVVPGQVRRRFDDVVTVERAGRDHAGRHVEAVRGRQHLARELLEHRLVVADRVELVDHRDDGRHAHQRADRQVPVGLLADPFGGVDE